MFVNAWNQWSEGAALEPSVQWGRRWLEATRSAIKEEQYNQACILQHKQQTQYYCQESQNSLFAETPEHLYHYLILAVPGRPGRLHSRLFT